MTSKKRRQRGSRTHGRGSHKNGRGAGNRGGRGDAGRDKHESHNYEPLGKSGFSRPPDAVEEDPEEVNISDIDQHLFYKIGKPGRLPETDVRVHARELDCVDSDNKVKVLGAGRRDDGAPSEPALAPDGGTISISIPVEVVADAFTESARQRIETAGGTAVVPSSKDPVKIKTTVGQHGIMLERDQRTVEGAERLVESGRVLADGVVDQLVGYAQETEKYDEVYDVLLQNYRNKSEIEPIDAANAISFRVYAEDSGFDTPDLDRMLEDYFANVEFSEAAMSDLSEGLPESIPANRTGDIMRDRREKIRDATVDVFNPDDMEELDRKISELQREYLYLIRNRIESTT